LSWAPGQTGPPGSPVFNDSQLLKEENQIRSDQDLILGVDLTISQVSQIAEIRELQEEQKEVASLLSQNLQQYVQMHPPEGGCEAFPSQLILARCLAVADIETLQETLRNLDRDRVTAGKKYAWFVTVFLDRIHGIDPEIASAAFAQSRHRKKPQPEAPPLFHEEIVQQTAAKVRKLA
jgi:hypothetical protein